MGYLYLLLITWFLGHPQVHIPNSISIGAAVFAAVTSVLEKRTQTTQLPQVTVGRPHAIGNESVPKIIIRDSINSFF